MVEDLIVELRGIKIHKKILCITNKQAALFESKSMAQCIQALELGSPKFVIKLCPSISVKSQNIIAH